MQKKTFTLVELLVAMVVFAIIFTVLFGLFSRMMRIKIDVEARTTLIQRTYDITERLNKLLQDYTIDYEEYFNRRMVGCSTANANPSNLSSFTWDIGSDGYCTRWTSYGNGSPVTSSTVYSTGTHMIYACSSTIFTRQGDGSSLENRIIERATASSWDGCYENLFSSISAGSVFHQPYGEYKAQTYDVREDVDDKPGQAGDDDDTDTGIAPVAIGSNESVKELYLIAKDKKTRILMRRRLVGTGDWDNNGVVNLPTENHYILEMLQLRGFDAGPNHNFDNTNGGVYDGVIDTWACDTSAGYVCNGASIGSLYADYHLPANGTDGWIPVIGSGISVLNWNIKITPTRDPDIAWNNAVSQQNPFITLTLQTSIFDIMTAARLGMPIINNLLYDVQTSFNMRTFY